MIKIWLLVLFISIPEGPGVKHNAFLYHTEEECLSSLAEYLNIYESKSPEYKQNLTTDGYCLSFDAFPIRGFHKIDSLYQIQPLDYTIL